MGNICCSSLHRDSQLSSININDVMQRASMVERQLDQIESPTSRINIKMMTWNKDSYDLFDFENQQRIVQTLSIEKSVRLFRDETSGSIQEEGSISSAKTLLHVEFHQKCFWVQPKQKNNPDAHPIWLVIRSIQSSTKTSGVRIGVGDVIRIGKIEMKLRELNYNVSDKQLLRSTTIFSNESDGEEVCRLCLNGTETDENPKISPCNCTGTMAYIHLECLQHWIAAKQNIDTENQNAIVFLWDTMKCELCKASFNRQIKHGGKIIDLVQKSKCKFRNYALFEMKRKMVRNDDQVQKITYILNLDGQDAFKIGRANDNHVRLQDISVSRCHCKLVVQNQELYIQDNNSKFGTLLKIRQPIPLFQDLNQVQFQAGRTVFEFETCDGFHYQMLGFQYHKLF